MRVCIVYVCLSLSKMSPAMINSTNSVSTTRRKRDAERSVNWTEEETQVLLCAWSDERIQKSLVENLRNTHIFKHLSARMSEMGFSRSPHQCRLRVKTLKANYVRAKLQQSVDASQPCSFKYFAEMDAVLGRRSVGGGVGRRCIFQAGMATLYIDGTGNAQSNLNSNIQFNAHHPSSFQSTGSQSLSSVEEQASRHFESVIKLEDREQSTDEFESSDAGFSQHPRDGCHRVLRETAIHTESNATTMENSLSTPLPRVLPPLPPPEPAASPLPAPSGKSPNTLLTSSHRHPESSCLEPALTKLLKCFQELASDTQGLLVQLESQRQEYARWHQELLSQWLQREERRQRETAEREERREKARMEHEIRVLELLTSLTKQQECTCREDKGRSEAPTGPNHTMNRDGN
ncbi:uncharacterized protein ACNS7B_010593 [Menidia menidia]|uniref:(Atlantic silverside) hypothetical protein n=1 Tax=Menidia menidia TaxID=238744 RepID=A0A8S4B2F5_9TELE|nr:unnamed protein product [Menidia menidia]